MVLSRRQHRWPDGTSLAAYATGMQQLLTCTAFWLQTLFTQLKQHVPSMVHAAMTELHKLCNSLSASVAVCGRLLCSQQAKWGPVHQKRSVPVAAGPHGVLALRASQQSSVSTDGWRLLSLCFMIVVCCDHFPWTTVQWQSMPATGSQDNGQATLPKAPGVASLFANKLQAGTRCITSITIAAADALWKV